MENIGSCTYYIWNQIREFCDCNIDKMLDFVEVIPVPVSESRGILTGKYAAKDLIQVYLGVIQNRTFEIEGFQWPLSTH